MPNFTLDDSVFVEAAQRFGTPLYLYDERGIRQAARRLRRAFSWNPGFREFYAVKALPNPAILRIALEEGCGLDCSSEPELMLAEMAGATGRDIMFSANGVAAHELKMARGMGAFINLDDQSDIPLLAAAGIPETVSLRVNPGAEGEGQLGFMGGAFDAKYGFMPDQLPAGLEQLKQGGARRFGLHAMTASSTLDGSYFARNAAYLFALGKRLMAQSGLELDFVNLSGGLGIPYRLDEQALDMDQVGALVQAEYLRAFGAGSAVRVFTELGRWLTGPYGWLLARVIHKKEIWRDYIGLDASASNLMRPMMYGAYHHASVIGKREAPHSRVYDLTGSLCENSDKFAVQRSLPEIEIGDLVLLHDAGAHGHAMGYQYNGRLRCAELLYTQGGGFRLIRRAETPEDYFSTLVDA